MRHLPGFAHPLPPRVSRAPLPQHTVSNPPLRPPTSPRPPCRNLVPHMLVPVTGAPTRPLCTWHVRHGIDDARGVSGGVGGGISRRLAVLLAPSDTRRHDSQELWLGVLQRGQGSGVAAGDDCPLRQVGFLDTRLLEGDALERLLPGWAARTAGALAVEGESLQGGLGLGLG